MTSDGRGEGGSAKSDFITKGSLIKHLMRGEGGSKKGKNHLTSYMDSPKSLFSARLKKVRNYDRNSSDHVSKGQIVISAAQEIGNNTVQIKTL